MKSASCWTLGTVGGPGAFVFCWGTQWIFAIFEPSGNGLPLPGIPERNASMTVGFPRMAAIKLPFWLMETSCQFSYPRNSEKASPPGTETVYLSCADTVLDRKTANIAPIRTSAVIPTASIRFRLICNLRLSDAKGASRPEDRKGPGENRVEADGRRERTDSLEKPEDSRGALQR